MKQLLQNMKNGKTSVEEIPVPSPRPGTALVRTAASLVSAGTERMVVEFARRSLAGKARSRPDLVRQVLDRARREGLLGTAQAAIRRLDQPLALGYSSAGTVVALGQGLSGLKVGQRVACAGGGYAVHAEYALVPRNLLAPLPDGVDFESAAFTTLGAIGLHGFRLADPQVGERVAVIGLGLLGLMSAQIALAAGCEVFGVDVDAARVRLASSLGIRASNRARAVEAGQAFTRNRGFDIVLICADTPSNDPVELAAVIARDRARVVAIGAVGLDLPRRGYYEKELSFINSRSYGPGRYDPAYEEQGEDYPLGYVRWTEGRNLEAVVELLASGRLNVSPLITHRFSISNAARAYDLITGKRRAPFLGVLLTYPEPAAKRPPRIEYKPVAKPQAAVRLGVIGAGNFANAVLLPAIKKAGAVELIGVASAGGVDAQHAARAFGFSYAASSANEIINDVDLNTVAVLTRHDTHAELAIKALRAGKNVFIEKPLAITREQVLAIEKQLSKPGNHLLTVGFNRRFSRLSGELLAAYRDRQEPMHVHYRINAGQTLLTHWTQDPVYGGRILGEACHFVDLIAFLVGAPPASVVAHALPEVGKYRDDNVTMTFTFPDGSIGVVDYLANGDRSFAKERVEVFCAGRIAILDDFRTLDLIADGRRRRISRAQDKGWIGEWKAFAAAIRDGGLPPIPYDHLLGVAKAMLAAVESLRTQARVNI